MKNLWSAVIPVTAIAALVAVVVLFAEPLPHGPAATAQARAAISELPIEVGAKASFLSRVDSTSEAALPSLVEEARRSVDLPVGCHIEFTHGIATAIVDAEGKRIPLYPAYAPWLAKK